jgi:hypothetical protein
VISETDRLTDAARLLGTSLSGLSASVRSIAVRLGLARPTELVTLARRHAVLDAASEAICGLDASYLWARAMPAAEFLERSERGLLAEPPPTPSGSDVNRSLRKPVELPPEEVYDSVRAALSDDEAEDPAVRGLGFGRSADHRSVGPQFSQRRARRPGGTVRTLHGNDKEAGLRAPVATAEDITDSFPLAEEQRRAAALEAPGRLAGGTDHEINEPAQFILDHLAFLANIWGPTARAWSCHCRT